MIRIFVTVICISLLLSCNSKSSYKANKVKPTQFPHDSVTLKVTGAKTAINDLVTPTIEEVKAEYLKTYNAIVRIDTSVVIGADTFYIHEKYYCLHDSTLVIPKKYIWGGEKKDFVTHNFVSKILIIKNRDTIINRTFKKSDFNSALHPEEKQYAILFTPDFNGYSKLYDGIVFEYSISIPLTDVGVPAYVLVDKKGNYKILDEYAKINED
jgi:hypothetical protein